MLAPLTLPLLQSMTPLSPILCSSVSGQHASVAPKDIHPAEEVVLVQEMMHFVDNLQQYFNDRLLVTAWAQLERVSADGAWRPHVSVLQLQHSIAKRM